MVKAGLVVTIQEIVAARLNLAAVAARAGEPHRPKPRLAAKKNGPVGRAQERVVPSGARLPLKGLRDKCMATPGRGEAAGLAAVLVEHECQTLAPASCVHALKACRAKLPLEGRLRIAGTGNPPVKLEGLGRRPLETATIPVHLQERVGRVELDGLTGPTTAYGAACPVVI